jgi:transcriptional regulator with XRE-family HTH domain
VQQRTPAQLLESVAANIRRIRKRRGYTQEQLAERAALDLKFLQKVETGTSNISIVTLWRVTEALGVDATKLMQAAHLPKAKRGRPRGKAKSEHPAAPPMTAADVRRVRNLAPSKPSRRR